MTGSSRRGALTGVAAGLLAVAAGAVTFAARSDEAPVRNGALSPLAFEPGVVHVHGLGVDPADGVLYAATHSGLFRIPEGGEPVRIANREQDTMGFAVTGPRTFVGSGHPDSREDKVRPPLLGLIESTDAGETWQRISLHGQADFHALRVAGGQIYGYDATSGTFMVTADKRTWDRRSRLPMRDFAVSPASPDAIVATTEQGVVRSSDGGRTWQPVAGAPSLVVVAWPAGDALYGVAPDGTTYRSADGGTSWVRRGGAGGPPAALTVDRRNGAEAMYVAVHDVGIVASSDGGATFTTRYRQSPGG